MKDHQGVGPATLKPPTFQPRAEGFNQNNNQTQHGDNSNMTTYTYVGKMPSAFGQLDQALEDAKKTLEEEKMLIPEVKYKEENIVLNKKEMLFFEVLIANQNRITTYDELQEQVWGDDVMTDSALRSLVRNLRKKLPTDVVFNLSGVGYRFV